MAKKRGAKKATHASMKKATMREVKGMLGGANRVGGNRSARGMSNRTGGGRKR